MILLLILFWSLPHFMPTTPQVSSHWLYLFLSFWPDWKLTQCIFSFVCNSEGFTLNDQVVAEWIWAKTSRKPYNWAKNCASKSLNRKQRMFNKKCCADNQNSADSLEDYYWSFPCEIIKETSSSLKHRFSFCKITWEIGHLWFLCA